MDFKHKSDLMWPSITFEVILNVMKYLSVDNVSIHTDFYQNWFINEGAKKIFLKFQ